MLIECFSLAAANPFPAVLFSLLAYIAYSISHALFFSPLRKIPGPFIRRLTALPLLYTTYNGTEARTVAQLHERYGPVVLIAPHDLDVSDPEAIGPIYVAKNGLPKIERYLNYAAGGHQTLFSTLDNGYRAIRAKAVAPMFALGRIRHSAHAGVVRQCIDDFVKALQHSKIAAESMPYGRKTVDLLDMSRRLANDTVTGYMFNERYGALAEVLEQQERPSAFNEDVFSGSPFIDAFVGISRFWLLPRWLFVSLWEITTACLTAQQKTSESLVMSYVARIVDSAAFSGKSFAEQDTYQSRLLDIGISRSETMMQCEDLIVAGSDSTGITLASTLWHLSRQPETLERLRDELANSPRDTPYLHAVIREGLRLCMANPPRMPRTVPGPEPFHLSGTNVRTGEKYSYTLPAGTQLGCSSHVLHLDPFTFPSPHAFRPERWLSDGPLADAFAPRENRQLRDTRIARQKSAMFAFGAGLRQCIARTLAQEEFTEAVRAVVESGVLDAGVNKHDGGHTQVRPTAVGESIEVLDWFNSRVVDGKIELRWA